MVSRQVLMKFVWIRGRGIFIEVLFLLIINSIITIFYIDDINFPFKIPLKSAIDIIAISTSLVLAIGFIYYVGYMIARRKKEPNAGFGGINLRDVIIPYGALLFLGFSMPLLMAFLIKSGKSNIISFVVINTVLAFIFGFFNEKTTQDYEDIGIQRDQRI